MDSVTKGLTKLDSNFYIDRETGDIFTIHGNWLKTPIGSIAGTELYDMFIESYGTQDGLKTRIAISKVLKKSFNQL